MKQFFHKLKISLFVLITYSEWTHSGRTRIRIHLHPIQTMLTVAWRSWLERSSRMGKVGRSNLSRDRP